MLWCCFFVTWQWAWLRQDSLSSYANQFSLITMFLRQCAQSRKFIEWQIICSQDFVLIISKMSKKISVYSFFIIIIRLSRFPCLACLAGVNAIANWQMSFNSSNSNSNMAITIINENENRKKIQTHKRYIHTYRCLSSMLQTNEFSEMVESKSRQKSTVWNAYVFDHRKRFAYREKIQTRTQTHTQTIWATEAVSR